MRHLVCAAGMAWLTACNVLDREEPIRVFARTIEGEGAKQVRAQVRLGAGELHIQGGGRKLLEADFRTRDPEPRVKYLVRDGRGELEIESRASGRRGGGDDRWNLRLEDTTPLNLLVVLGAGESRLDLKTVALERAEVKMGAGTLDLDLAGNYSSNVDVEVHGGVGQARIFFPKSIGVTIDAKGGIGSITARGLNKKDDGYVNAAYGSAKNEMRVRVRGGVGQIDLICE